VRSAYRLATQLTTLGVEMVEVPQNFRHLSEASKDFEAKVLSKRMLHDGNKLVRWTVDNAAIDHDKNGNIRPIKPKDRRKKVDPVVAAVIANPRVIVAPPGGYRPSIFDNGPIVLGCVV
jgi:phage terminase large subunit-like protein